MYDLNSTSDYCALCSEPLDVENIAQLRYDERAHYHCAFRTIIGGANHILEKCSCFGGTLPADPPGLTSRQTGVASVKVFESLKPTEAARREVDRKIKIGDLHDPCEGVPVQKIRPKGQPTIWLIFERPADFPEEFVARNYTADKAWTGKIIRAHRLAKLRQLLRDSGLIRNQRDKDDHQSIIEAWI